MRRPSPRRVMWVSGVAWIVSRSCLGLEIFHWHHVTKMLHACGVPRRRHRDAGGQVAQAAAKAYRRGGTAGQIIPATDTAGTR